MIRFLKFACLWLAACSLAFLAPAQNLQHRRKAFRTTPSSDSPGTANVLAYWDLQANGNDSSSNARNMSAAGTPTYVTGLVGNALSIGDTSTALTITSASWMTPSGSFTVCGWVKPADGQTANNQTIIGRWDTTGNNRSFALEIDSSGKAVFRFSDNGMTSGVTTATTNALANGAASGYTFIAGVFTASTNIKIYWNGSLDATYSTSIPAAVASVSASLEIGRRGATSTTVLQGQIDSVGFFNRVLTAAEITWLYNSGNGRAFSDL